MLRALKGLKEVQDDPFGFLHPLRITILDLGTKRPTEACLTKDRPICLQDCKAVSLLAHELNH